MSRTNRKNAIRKLALRFILCAFSDKAVGFLNFFLFFKIFHFGAYLKRKTSDRPTDTQLTTLFF